MDSYLASQHLHEADGFFLNLNFEVLNGCKFKCPGCFVDLNGQKAFTQEDLDRLESLVNSADQSMYKPFIAFIAPTDFLVADNTVAVLSDPRFSKILKSFRRISLQTTYLDLRNMSEIIHVLKNFYNDLEIEINIIIDPARITDDTHLALIEKNKKSFLDALGRNDVRTFGIMNVYDYDQTKIPELLKNYDLMHKRVEHLFETTIDYNFSIGRSKQLTSEEFLSSAFRIKELFDHSLVSGEKAQYLRFSFGKLTDSLIERQYNYRAGALYYSPLLYERYVSFKDEFKLPLNSFAFNEIEEYEQEVQLEQYAAANDYEECSECPFVASCIDRGILKMMNIYETKKCLVAKKALLTVNNMMDRLT